jgi:hypothetical protein
VTKAHGSAERDGIPRARTKPPMKAAVSVVYLKKLPRNQEGICFMDETPHTMYVLFFIVLFIGIHARHNLG